MLDEVFYLLVLVAVVLSIANTLVIICSQEAVRILINDGLRHRFREIDELYKIEMEKRKHPFSYYAGVYAGPIHSDGAAEKQHPSLSFTRLAKNAANTTSKK